MHKITCLRCENISFTAARDTHMPCPYCGFVQKGAEPDRRIGNRQITHRVCDLLKDDIRLPVKTVDVSETGLGIKVLGHLPFDQDETINVTVEDLEIAKKAQVVWTRHIYGISRAGLRFC